ncbi:hypothetical protein B0T16DRAFT_392267 [Cercophora newfieldiana]|uniref:Uncharacterized protein n=1 Tax=Cercophora newfieldiana TaxID=92897 RepID=A0AA39Y0M8_9PEZI|nr:hypothetical protein B0T16DRAFT_392267 [Cercophora newfieldiana]
MTTTLAHGVAPLAALTSVFTPPCPTSWLLTGTRLPSQLPIFPRTGPASCDPPSWLKNLEGGGFQYYSPAICPRGFAVGPDCGLTKARTDEGFPSVIPGENVAYCVPIGMSCTTDTTDFRGGVWGWNQVVTAPGAAVTVGPAMQIRWRDSDLEVLETHPLTPGLRRQAVATDIPTTSGQTFDPAIRTVTTILSVPTSSPSPTTSTSGTGQPGKTENSSEGGRSIDRPTAAFVITILTVIAGVMLGILALILFLRRRSGKFGGPGRLGFPHTIVGWLASKWASHRGQSSHDEKNKLDGQDDIAGAELGLHGQFHIQSLPPELEPGPARGSTHNPAELDGWGVGPRPRRWSGVPQRPRRPDSVPDGELPHAIHRLSSVTELTEASHEKVEERPPMVPPKSEVPPAPLGPERPKIAHIRSTSRSLTVSHPKPVSLAPNRPARPASIGVVSPLSPPGTPVFGNQTIVYSDWKNADEK